MHACMHSHDVNFHGITLYFFFSSIEGKLDFSDPTKEASLPKGKKSIFGSNIFIHQLQKA